MNENEVKVSYLFSIHLLNYQQLVGEISDDSFTFIFIMIS